MLEVLGSDYIQLARLKGMSEGIVLWRHGFKNAMLPVITTLGMVFSFLLGGAVRGGAREFVAYHAPERMGYSAREVTTLEILTDRRVSDGLLGGRVWLVWLVTGEGRPIRGLEAILGEGAP